MNVYIEYVILDNVIIDYLLLYATFKITGKQCKKGRLLFCAFIGAIVALIYPLLTNFAILQTTVKILGGLLIVLLACSYKNLRDYHINTAIFLLLTFLTGGVIIGVFNVFGVDYNSEGVIALIFIPALVVISCVKSVIKSIYRNRQVRAFVYKTEMVFDKKTTTVNGFLDTGNALFDGDSPVIICNKKLFFDVLGNAMLKKKLKTITVNTINGTTQNLCYKLDKVVIYDGQSVNINSNVTLALGKTCVGDGYDVILNPQLLKGESDESAFKTQKIS